MAKKSNFIKNLLTTASAVAVIAGGASTAYAGAGVGNGFSRPSAGIASINGGGFLSDDGSAAAYTAGHNIINSRTDAPGGADFTVDAAAGDFGSFDVRGNNGKTITLTGGNNLSLGAVYNSEAGGVVEKGVSEAAVKSIANANAYADAGGNINARVGVKIAGAEVLALTGKAAVVAAGAGAGGGSDPANMGAKINLYTSLGEIDFNDNGGTLIANSANGGTIVLKGASVIKAATGGKLELTTDLTVDDASFAKIKINEIAAGKALTFNVNTNIENVGNATYDFKAADSKIVFNVDNSGGDKTIKLYADLKQTANDLDGNVEFESKSKGMLLTVTGDAPRTIGVSNAKRLTQIEFKGVGDFLLDANVTPFAKTILHSGAGNVIITNAAYTKAADGTVSVTGAGELKFLGAVTANTATVSGGGILTLSADSTINTTNITKGTLEAKNVVLAGKLNLGDIANRAKAFATVKEITNDTVVDYGATLDVLGKIGGKLDVKNSALVTGTADVTGVVTIDTDNDKINTIKDAASTVTLTKGNLTMNDASDDVTITNGKLIMNDIKVGKNLVASGGETTVHSIAGNATLSNAAIVNVSGNIGGNLASAANKGIVNFTGKGTVTGTVGNGSIIEKITIADTTTFVDAGFAAGELNFTTKGAKAVFNNTVNFSAANMAKVTLSKDSKDNIIQINKNNPITINGEINKDGDVNALTFLYTGDLNGVAAVKLDVTSAAFRANIESTFDKRLDVKLGANVVGDVGNLGKDSTRRLNSFTFDNNAQVTVGNVYAGTINVNDNKTARFREGSTINADSFTIGSGGNSATAIFADKVTINSVINAHTRVKGVATFEGDVEINKAITGLEVMNFDGDGSVAKLNDNITVGSINANSTSLIADKKSLIVDSKTVAEIFGAKAGKTLTFAAHGNTALTLKTDAVICSEISANNGVLSSAGKTVIDSSSIVDISGTKNIKVEFDDESSDGLVSQNAMYTIFDNQGTPAQGVDLTSLNISKEVINTNGDSLVEWVATSDKTKIYVISKDNSAKTFEKNALENGGDAIDVQNLTNLYANGTAGQRKELFAMNGASRIEAIERMDPTDASAVVSDITTGISAGLGSRISSLVGAKSSSVQNKVASNGTTGLSAGDDETRYGVWISPFFNQAVQKANKGSAGYDASTAGGSFGFDTKANDDMVVGLALSMLSSDVKYKDYKSGDKNKINSAMFSVYGMQQITDNWFGQGLITVGTSKVTTNEKRKLSNTTYQNATGSYNSMSFSGEALVGYNYVMSDFSITPMGGLRVSTVSDDGYTETGTTNQNLSIARKSLNKAEIVVGARVGGPAYDLNGVSVTPELHGFLNQDMVGKNAKVDIKTVNGVQLLDNNFKPNKTTFNVGAGLDAKYSYMEYGIAYDANISKKFMSNQGTIKVRLNF